MPFKDRQKKLEYDRQYYRDHWQQAQQYRKVHKKHKANYNKEWHKKHPKYHLEWYKKNRKKCIAVVRKSQKKHWIEIRERHRIDSVKRRATLKGRIDNRMASSISRCLRGNKEGRKWESLVGYTVEDLKQHLEKGFNNGMNWQKFMQGKIHIDHIIPKVDFKYKYPEDEEFKKCWGLNNLRPLYARENIRRRFLEAFVE